MKKHFFGSFASLLFLVVISLTPSCKGDQGEIGPQGPAGVAGPAGDPGPAGSANVHTETFNIDASNWVDNGEYSTIDLNPSTITADIANTGIVLAYGYFVGSGQWQSGWHQLPYTIVVAGSYTETFAYSYDTNWLQLLDSPSDGFQINPSMTLKVVTIPSEGRKQAEQAGIDLKDYNQVATFFKIH
jgi:hypothetical protein